MENFEQAKQLFLNGLNLFENGKYREAELNFLNSLELVPDRVSTLTNLSATQIKLRKLEEAKVNSQKAISIDSGSVEAWLNLGIIELEKSNTVEAINFLKNATKIDKDLYIAWLLLAGIYDSEGQLTEAIYCYKNILRIFPNQFEALSNIGAIYNDQNKFREALEYHENALRINPNHYETLSNRGIALGGLKNYDEALEAHDQALKLNPGYAEGWSNKGLTFNDLKRYDEALEAYNQALKLNPGYAECWSNKGNTLYDLKRYDEALAHHDKAIQLKPDYAEAWSNKGNTLYDLKRYDEALAHHDKAIQLKPGYAEAWSNKGITLNDLRCYDEALAHHDKAIQLKPDYAEAWSNKGVTLSNLKRYDEALAHHDKAIQLKPDYAEAWFNKGATLCDMMMRFEEGLACYEKAYSLEPAMDYLLGNLIHTKMLICNWRHFETKAIELIGKVKNNEKTTPPFVLLSIIDSPEMHLKAAETWVKERYPADYSLPPIPIARKNKKIRIGYFSADLKNHPVSFLMAELFEVHDRNGFEIFAFSFEQSGPDDEMRRRLTQTFDHFIDVQDQSDLEVARLSRKLGIDIAVDLGGHTQGSRTAIFSCRAAPVQVNFLGYPGTMGAEYIDYIIADKCLIPDIDQHAYSEKIIYLPHCFQPNDSKRVIAARKYSREELKLPNDGFVFCCFNNSYKIAPKTFSSWMMILKSSEQTCLWLLENSASVESNLKNEAERKGVDPARLIFGGRLPPSEYLARYRSADLFLDTLPFNAGTTASDALWAGLPVLTCAGNSFSGRMAASLLNAIGLPELITQTQEEYESLAIELASNPGRLNQIKQKLSANRLNAPLFNTPLFTRNIEAAYTNIYDRYQAGLAPDHIYVDP